MADNEYWAAFPIDDREPTDVVYHYTTAAGLVGILENRVLHATDMRFLNDSHEFIGGLDQVSEILNERVSTRLSQFRQLRRQALYGYTLNEITETSSEKMRQAREHYLYGVTCFCENDDLLSQWRGYGVGGYAIGFDSNRLKLALDREAIRLLHVVYGLTDENRSTIAAKFDVWLDNLDGLERLPQEQAEKAMLNFQILFLGYAAQIKDPSFQEENEWRIADLEVSGAPDCFYRAADRGVIPYVKIQIARNQPHGLLPIVSVRVGPGADYEDRMWAVRSLLAHHNYGKEVHVKRSSIPYRGA